MGHENAGWVEAVGDAVTSVRVGDPVIVHPMRTCGVCWAGASAPLLRQKPGRFLWWERAPGAKVTADTSPVSLDSRALRRAR
ncbi:alcohol dehydrogenase catalytic domain-containing protein [Pseudonocardia kunmingensis]|uniref:alcohol dehydrogenase catalytic domain-containing protein n=1 Tax=Pseudonocardia kunmingensis TaxID=630975 RepID=UPI001154DB64